MRQLGAFWRNDEGLVEVKERFTGLGLKVYSDETYS